MCQKRLLRCVMGIMLFCLSGVKSSFAGWSNTTPALSTKTLNAVWGTSPSDMYAVGDNGTILYYNGTDWSVETSNTTGKLLSIWGSSSTDIYVVGNEETGVNTATLLHKSTSGATWELEQAIDYVSKAYFNYNLTAIWGYAADHVYIGDQYGELFMFDGTG